MLAIACVGTAMMAGVSPSGASVGAESHAMHVVAFTLGATEFFGDDLVEVKEIRGTAPKLVSGGTYVVTGRYRLSTKREATLLLSATTSRPGQTGLEVVRSRRVEKGAGEFKFRFTVAEGGYLHLTYYDVETGKPFGGVYFGQGEGVLRHKSWRYDNPKLLLPRSR